MLVSDTIDYIAQPLDAADITMLRNAAVCGVTALVIVMVGLSKLLVLVFYLLVIGIIAAATWLYSLERTKRAMVIERIKEVFNSLVQKCVDQVLKGSVVVEKTTEHDSCSPTGDSIECAAKNVRDVTTDRSQNDRKSQPVELDQNAAPDYAGLFD